MIFLSASKPNKGISPTTSSRNSVSIGDLYQRLRSVSSGEASSFNGHCLTHANPVSVKSAVSWKRRKEHFGFRKSFYAIKSKFSDRFGRLNYEPARSSEVSANPEERASLMTRTDSIFGSVSSEAESRDRRRVADLHGFQISALYSPDLHQDLVSPFVGSQGHDKLNSSDSSKVLDKPILEKIQTKTIMTSFTKTEELSKKNTNIKALSAAMRKKEDMTYEPAQITSLQLINRRVKNTAMALCKIRKVLGASFTKMENFTGRKVASEIRSGSNATEDTESFADYVSSPEFSHICVTKSIRTNFVKSFDHMSAFQTCFNISEEELGLHDKPHASVDPAVSSNANEPVIRFAGSFLDEAEKLEKNLMLYFGHPLEPPIGLPLDTDSKTELMSELSIEKIAPSTARNVEVADISEAARKVATAQFATSESTESISVGNTEKGILDHRVLDIDLLENSAVTVKKQLLSPDPIVQGQPDEPISEPHRVEPARTSKVSEAINQSCNHCIKTMKEWSEYNPDKDNSAYGDICVTQSGRPPLHAENSSSMALSAQTPPPYESLHECSSPSNLPHTKSKKLPLESCWKSISLEDLFAEANKEICDLSPVVTLRSPLTHVVDDNVRKRISDSGPTVKASVERVFSEIEEEPFSLEESEKGITSSETNEDFHQQKISSRQVEYTETCRNILISNTVSWTNTKLLLLGLGEEDLAPITYRPTTVRFVDNCNNGASVQVSFLDMQETNEDGILSKHNFIQRTIKHYSEFESLRGLENVFSQIEHDNTPIVAQILTSTINKYRLKFLHLLKYVVSSCSNDIKEMARDTLATRKLQWELFSQASALDNELATLVVYLEIDDATSAPLFIDRLKGCSDSLGDIDYKLEIVQKAFGILESGIEGRLTSLTADIAEIKSTREDLLQNYKIFYELNLIEGRIQSDEINRCTHVDEYEENTTWHYYLDVEGLERILKDDIACLRSSMSALEGFIGQIRNEYASLKERHD